MNEPYKVVIDPNHVGCATCGHDSMWAIEGPDGTLSSTSWADKEIAEDICDLVNMGHEAGLKAKEPSA